MRCMNEFHNYYFSFIHFVSLHLSLIMQRENSTFKSMTLSSTNFAVVNFQLSVGKFQLPVFPTTFYAHDAAGCE